MKHNEKQLELPLFDQGKLPRKPYCTNDLATGLKVRPLKQAIEQRYIQPNPPGMTHFLLFDLDRPDAGSYWIEANAQPPSFVIKNPENGHAHYLYALQNGVCTTSAARQKPMRYLAAIEQAMCRDLKADPGYAGLITKNPLHPHWQTIPVHTRLYSLADLALDLDLTSPANDERESYGYGVGRNCSVFDELRHWAYRSVIEFWRPGGFEGWQRAVRERAHGCNMFANPLQQKEIDQIAKSVAKWVWKNFSPATRQALIERTHTPELQSKRGQLKGKALRERGLELLSAGLTASQVAAEIGASRRTAERWQALLDEN
jgi:hypothetical protein